MPTASSLHHCPLALRPPLTLQAQQIEYDEAAVRDQVVDTYKHVKVVEWLKVREGVSAALLPMLVQGWLSG
jgi:hypothetical protein